MSDHTERHPAPDPRDDDEIRVVGDKDAEFECSVCGDWVHRFSVRYHGEGQYCVSCWNRVEPHRYEAECTRCEGAFMRDTYETNLVTFVEGVKYRKPELCEDCTSVVFPNE